MSRIHALSPFVANQIAAGEVIERPASVVKELLENSWDAGATEITIELRFGGLNQIKISDNGVGIDADDLPLAIAQHATSKIIALSDLYSLNSMGFRGEALASIASVSRLELSSKPIQQNYAMCLRSDESGVNISPCARAPGTSVDVLDLFYNAPVRKKFLKSSALEYHAVEEVVKRFALSALSVAVTLIHDGKKKLVLPVAHDHASKLLRLQKIAGKAFVDNAIYVEAKHLDMEISGFISGVVYQRSQQDQQWMYLNQRMLKDKLMYRALRQAYDGFLHPGRYPACVLYCLIPKEEVDVNVHPTKHEVRFQNPRLVHDFMYTTLNAALSSSPEATVKPVVKENALSAWRDAVPQVFSSNLEWVALTTSFAIIFLKDRLPYLVDLEKAAHHYYQATKEPWPLASRRLLVPIEYSLTQDQLILLNALRALFLKIGIQWEVRQNTLQIQTLPQRLPQLHLPSLWERLTLELTTPNDLLVQILKDYVWNVWQWPLEQRMALSAYLEEKIHQIPADKLGCKLMDDASCKGIVYDKN